MAKYHVNPETGNPGLCKATVRPCRYGVAEEEHFSSREEAQAAFERKQAAPLPSSRRREASYNSFQEVEETFGATTLLKPVEREGFRPTPTLSAELIAAHSPGEWRQVAALLREQALEERKKLSALPPLTGAGALGKLAKAYRRAEVEYNNPWDKSSPITEQHKRYHEAHGALMKDPTLLARREEAEGLRDKALLYAEGSALAQEAAKLAEGRTHGGEQVPAGYQVVPAIYDLQGNLMGVSYSRSSRPRVMRDSEGRDLIVGPAAYDTPDWKELNRRNRFYEGTAIAPVTLGVFDRPEGLEVRGGAGEHSPALWNAVSESYTESWQPLLHVSEVRPLKRDSRVKNTSPRSQVSQVVVVSAVAAATDEEAVKLMRPTADNGASS